MILLIDNYDSFVFNLARYFEQLGEETSVVRNDDVDVDQMVDRPPDAIVISPGPCTPREAGCSIEVIRRLHNRVPMLGVCLGHQAIAAALGGNVVRAPQPVHGRTSLVHHDGDGLFAGLDNPFRACRYHSLAVEAATLPRELGITATTADNVVMALRHWEFPVYGVQFHPEAILTQSGYRLLANFLELAGRPSIADAALPQL